MTVATRSGYAVFQPRARLLKLIGAELISDDVVAVTELVKNGHDADARQVVVEFRGVSGPDGRIVVRDDGCGMDVEALLQHWMQPAGTSKSAENVRFTPSGRRVLGEKGVGRFAADKLGRYLELVSRRHGDPYEVCASFDWDEFDSDSRMLSEISSRWEVRPATEIPDHGTLLRISGLRSAWTERMFRRLSIRLARLQSPFQEFGEFRIRIDSDEFPEYSGELNVTFLDNAPYRIDALFDGVDRIAVSVNGGSFAEHFWNGSDELRCGPVRVRLFAFDLETDALARVGPVMEVRAWLREWSGVSLYRDGFRVWPYGEPHDDWLRLDQRRVNNPVVRLSNNQVVGFVEISRDRNPELLDQTNREGLLHNVAFEDLRRLLYFVLQILEAERQARRHPVERRAGDKPVTLGAHGAVHETLGELAERAGSSLSRELGRLAKRLRAEAQGHEERYRRLIEGYGELVALEHVTRVAAVNIRATLERLRSEREAFRQLASRISASPVSDHAALLQSVLRHESGREGVASGPRRKARDGIASGKSDTRGASETSAILARMNRDLQEFKERIAESITGRLVSLIGDLESGLAALHRQLTTAVPSGLASAGRRRTIDLVDELRDLHTVLLPYMAAEGVRLEVVASCRALLRIEMRPELFHALLYSLLANSVEWTRGRKNRRVRISVRAAGGHCELLFEDNGPGIPPALADRVFEPLFSTKEAGRGMGLTVVKDILDRHGGRIDILTTGHRSGLKLRVRLPRKRSRALRAQAQHLP